MRMHASLVLAALGLAWRRSVQCHPRHGSIRARNIKINKSIGVDLGCSLTVSCVGIMTGEVSQPVPQGRRCFVSNLAWRTSWQDLKDHFKTCGNVVFANVMQDTSGVPGFRPVLLQLQRCVCFLPQVQFRIFR